MNYANERGKKYLLFSTIPVERGLQMETDTNFFACTVARDLHLASKMKIEKISINHKHRLGFMNMQKVRNRLDKCILYIYLFFA